MNVIACFSNALREELAGKANTGARQKLNATAERWRDGHFGDDCSLRQAIEATAKTIEFTAGGRGAVERALRRIGK